MREFFANKKALSLTALAVALVAALAYASTLAFFTDYDEVENVFTMGNIKIGIEEPNWEDGDGLDLVPGSVREKDPTVTAHEGQSYMRVRMELVDGANGALITDAERINLILSTLFFDKAYGSANPTIAVNDVYSTQQLEALVSAGKIYAEYNKDDFVFAGNEAGKPGVRYYNYKEIFDAAVPDIAVLFTNVVIPKEWSNEEICTLHGSSYEVLPNGTVEITAPGSGYKIILKAEAIQAAEMPNAATAFAALNEATGVVLA
ncbi:MAG: SipW-dependent-type signal peptide-containing protein [Eggerthellaceae bacterium]|jgi:predicted ribosomally synthesized peptide with SipW-like signal peptide|nr:SipW-dependent-type signal peptide-containing protein [Eggerthellaceae bacterium]